MRKFPRIVEAYLADLWKIRASGGTTREPSGYGPLANLLNEIGGGLKPKVFCVGELMDQRAAHPSFGIFEAKLGQPRDSVYDVYLNDQPCFRNVPRKVWN